MRGPFEGGEGHSANSGSLSVRHLCSIPVRARLMTGPAGLSGPSASA